MSITNRYRTSLRTIRSQASLMSAIAITSTSGEIDISLNPYVSTRP